MRGQCTVVAAVATASHADVQGALAYITIDPEEVYGQTHVVSVMTKTVIVLVVATPPFNSTTWLMPSGCVLCPGLLTKMGLPASGKKNRLGSLHGPMNEENINGTCPALLAGLPGLSCNSDVQLPYRMPVCASTHSSLCSMESCVPGVNEDLIIHAAQQAQNAQAGYACDYQNKRGSRCFNEVKEFKKGHERVAESCKGRATSYIGHRHAGRILSDCYNKGIVRSQQESQNLRAYGTIGSVTDAECIKTFEVCVLPGFDLVSLVEQHTVSEQCSDVDAVPDHVDSTVDLSHVTSSLREVASDDGVKTRGKRKRRIGLSGKPSQKTSKRIRAGATDACEENTVAPGGTKRPQALRLETDNRDRAAPTVVSKNTAYLYAHRPGLPEGCEHLQYLSPYEFFMHWHFCLARYPTTPEEVGDESKKTFHAMLTESGVAKVTQRCGGAKVKFQAGRDYVIKTPDGEQWLALPDVPAMKTLRHVWVLVRNIRPKVPTFMRCPMPKHGADDTERNAMLIHTYFHPYTLRKDCTSEHVPLIANLRADCATWEESLRYWLDGRVLSSINKRYIQNFMHVTQVRPDYTIMRGDSDNDFSDEELRADDCSLHDLLHTEVGGSKDDSAAMDMTQPSTVAKQKDAFSLCKRIWGVASDGGNSTANAPPSEEFDDWRTIVRAARRTEETEVTSPIRREPQMREGTEMSENSLTTWLSTLRNTECNEAQYQILKKVCDRVDTERKRGEINRFLPVSSVDENHPEEEPLLWLVHGGPGVGKSFVINKMRTLFEDVCGWTSGWDFQIGALQAVMADQIGGDTLHHALALNPFQNDDVDMQMANKTIDVARRVAQWRWLVIDEVSMLNAALVAEIDMRLRNLVSAVRGTKKDKRGQIRSFGGINVIFIGDFWQLDPPSGTPISAIPAFRMKRVREHVPAASTAHGQFWGRSTGCVQAITELTQCVRCHDS